MHKKVLFISILTFTRYFLFAIIYHIYLIFSALSEIYVVIQRAELTVDIFHLRLCVGETRAKNTFSKLVFDNPERVGDFIKNQKGPKK